MATETAMPNSGRPHHTLRPLALAGAGDVQHGDGVCIQPVPECRRLDAFLQRHDQAGLADLAGVRHGKAVPPSSVPRFRISVPSESSMLRRVRVWSLRSGVSSAGSGRESPRPRPAGPADTRRPRPGPSASPTSRAGPVHAGLAAAENFFQHRNPLACVKHS